MLSPGKGLSFSTHPSWRTPRTPGITPHFMVEHIPWSSRHQWCWGRHLRSTLHEVYRARLESSRLPGSQPVATCSDSLLVHTGSQHHQMSGPVPDKEDAVFCGMQGVCTYCAWLGTQGHFWVMEKAAFPQSPQIFYRCCSHSILFIPVFNSPWLEEFSAFPLVRIPPSLSPCLGRVAHLLQWTYKPKSTVLCLCSLFMFILWTWANV